MLLQFCSADCFPGLPRLFSLSQDDETIEALRVKADKLQEALPGVNIDVLISKHPVEVLNVDAFLVRAEFTTGSPLTTHFVDLTPTCM